MSERPRYGIDAPTVVRNLAVAAGALSLAAALVRHVAVLAPLHVLVPTMIATAVSTGAMALWMLASSLWLKQRVRDALLAERHWRGDERVLDVGCGRGLLAIGAAARTPHGEVVAFDRWQAADLSGNTPEAILANAAAADVVDRLRVETGDARPPLRRCELRRGRLYDSDPQHPRSCRPCRRRRRGLAGAPARWADADVRHSPRACLRSAAARAGRPGAADGTDPALGPIGWRFSAIKPN